MGCKPMEKPKQKHKKGLWSPDEDLRLGNHILKHGHGCWSSVPINAGLQRNGKSCRLRWINYLRPGLKRGMFTAQEEETVLTLHGMLGNKWSQIAQHLPGRTDNEIKNYWHSYLKKKLAKMEQTDQLPQNKTEYTSTNTGNFSASPLSSLNSTTRNQIFESFEHMEGSSTDTNQSKPQITNFPRESGQSNLPRLLFAEWLSLDQFQSQEFGNSVSNDSSDHPNPNIPDLFINGLLSDQSSFGRDFQQQLSDGSAEEMFHQQSIKTADNWFPNFIIEDDMCSSHFNISNDDVMYI